MFNQPGGWFSKSDYESVTSRMILFEKFLKCKLIVSYNSPACFAAKALHALTDGDRFEPDDAVGAKAEQLHISSLCKILNVIDTAADDAASEMAMLRHIQRAGAAMDDLISDETDPLLKGVYTAVKNAPDSETYIDQRMAAIMGSMADIRTMLQRLFNSKPVAAMLIRLRHDEEAGAASVYCVSRYEEICNTLSEISGYTRWLDLLDEVFGDGDEEADGLIRLDLTEFGYPAAYDAYAKDGED